MRPTSEALAWMTVHRSTTRTDFDSEDAEYTLEAGLVPAKQAG